MRADAPAEIETIWHKFVEDRSPELRGELITTYAPLVRFVVGRLGIPPTSLLDPEDLVSYGMIGLINAVDRFDPSRGIRFEAFASVRIRGAVIDQLRSLNWLPRSAISRVRQIESALATLEQKLGRPAKEKEVAEEMGLSMQRYRQILLEMNSTVLSLDAPLGSSSQEDEVTSLSELLEDHAAPGPMEQAEKQELTEVLGTAIGALPEREKLLLSLYYQEELTMKEISKVLGVSESRVCQLHMQAVMRLRTSLSSYRYGEGVSPVKIEKKRAKAGTGKRKRSSKKEQKDETADLVSTDESRASSPVCSTGRAVRTQESAKRTR